jgi:hypothetical protein
MRTNNAAAGYAPAHFFQFPLFLVKIISVFIFEACDALVRRHDDDDDRPYRKNGDIVAHHGIVIVNVLMRDSVNSYINWMDEHPAELVILYLSHFDSDSVKEDTANILSTLEVDMIREDQCDQLERLTVGGAKSRSGGLLAVFDCMIEQFVDNVECCDFSVYDNYMSTYSWFPGVETVNNGKLWMTQAHWQYGEFPDDPIDNEINTDLNNYGATNLADGEYNFLNFYQVDNVCNSGSDLLDAIKEYTTIHRFPIALQQTRC